MSEQQKPLVFTTGSEQYIQIRSYENWTILAEFPDDEEGYDAVEKWIEDNGYERVPWD